MRRRDFLSILLLAGCARPNVTGASEPAPPPAPPPIPSSGDAAFDAWRQGFLSRALARGIPAPVLVREFTGLVPDPTVLVSDAGQPELLRAPGDYITRTVSDSRIATGREKRAALTFWPQVEAAYGVPRDILIGVWAMESAFGTVMGDKDVIRALATLAADGRRRDWAEGELVAALRMIATDAVARERLTGSWAGAMGQTQFLPSTYLADAVDGDGDGVRDIWTSPADALASAANLLSKAHWARGQGWAREVILPAGFDYALTDAAREPWAAWSARGVRLASGAPLNAVERSVAAAVLVPQGHLGPAFLALPNHYVIRRYNNSMLYALAVGLLADRIGGAGPLRTPWPPEPPMTLADRQAAQAALRAQGFDPGEPDGRIGTRTRAALRGWQQARGLPADGFLSADMVRRLKAEPAPAAPAPAANAATPATPPPPAAPAATRP
jgi:lytic murein transglycosylase